MARTRRPLTKQEREQRRADQREVVRASIEQLRSSDGWTAYLKARRRFTTYSWRNVLLILSQHPTATRVAGFRAWLDLGYCVTKGSTGIRIWARCEPSQKRLQAWRDTGGAPAERPRTTYTLVCVFAQDQVTELRPPATPAPLAPPPAGEIKGDSHEDLIVELVALAGQIDYTVQITDTGAPDGTCDRTAHRIAIAGRLSANGRLATLIHEVAHALVGLDGDALKLSYAQEELVVESAAWSCCQAVGLDTSANSIPYLASWTQSAELEVLEQTAALTDRICDRIESALLQTAPDPTADTGPEVAAAAA
jgi:N-terminal domain of anti-restriction factor ArdC